MSLNLPPFVTTPFMLQNCYCIMALSLDSARKTTLLRVALHFLFYARVDKRIYTAASLGGLIKSQQS